MSEWTLNQCYDLVFGGLVAPGEYLDVADLSRRLSVSRSPLREALQRLEEDGLIESDSVNGRKRVVAFGASDIAELYEIRGSLEGTAARMAAGQASDEFLTELEQLLHKMESPDSTADAARDFTADFQFHEAIVRVTGRRRLLRSLAPMWLETRALLRQLDASGVYPGDDEISRVVVEHRAVLAALREHDATGAATAMDAHLTGAGGRLLRCALEARWTRPMDREIQ